MRYLLVLVTLLLSFHCKAMSYVNTVPQLYIGNFERPFDSDVENLIINHFIYEYNEYQSSKPSIEPLDFPFDIVNVENDKVTFYVNINNRKVEITPFVARVEKCDGIYSKCLVFDDVIQIYVPKEFDKGNVFAWEWKNYQYKVNRVVSYPFMGREVQAYEIVGYCETCEVKLSWFQYSKEVGVINFQYILKNGDGGFYMLTDSKGFLSAN